MRHEVLSAPRPRVGCFAEEALRAQLPGQEEPWLLLSAQGDPIAYFSFETELDGKPGVHIQADVSGRHFNDDRVVLEILQELRASIGGIVHNDA